MTVTAAPTDTRLSAVSSALHRAAQAIVAFDLPDGLLEHEVDVTLDRYGYTPTGFIADILRTTHHHEEITPA